jgi:hypothetical protein
LASPTEDNTRFILRYNYNVVLGIDGQAIDTSSIKTFFDGNTLVSRTENLDLPTRIEIHDLTGKKIASSPYKERLNNNDLSTGIYLVEFSFENGSTLTKKVLKN